jgi:hypothetical protein
MKRLTVLVFVSAALILAAVPLRASDPVSVYCIVNKVVLEPSETEPTTIQIWGAFALSGAPFTGNTYGSVQTGYLYYSCPKGRDSVCLSEWGDLKSVAGTGQIVGFGDRYGKTATRVRKADEKPASPDQYPINTGVVRMGHYAGVTYPELAKALSNAVARK